MIPAILAVLAVLAVLVLLFLAAATLYDYTRPRWRSTYDPEKETPPRGWKGQP